jgi:NAD(P)-dependent dehydrogenase (short-subunit alcohol dehydrogenase family)
MASQLEGKVAVVTGAAGGLGAASALRLSREGCSVVVVDLHHLNAGIPGGSSIVSTVRPSGGAGAWDFGALDERTYRPREA